jgi:FMN phosphatase YigB (HAD superfamily)
MSYEKLLEKIAQKEKSIGLTDTERSALTERLLEEREEAPNDESPAELVEKSDESAEKGEFKEAMTELDAAKKAGARIDLIENKMARLAEKIMKAEKIDPELLEVARAAAEYAKQLAEEHGREE